MLPSNASVFCTCVDQYCCFSVSSVGITFSWKNGNGRFWRKVTAMCRCGLRDGYDGWCENILPNSQLPIKLPKTRVNSKQGIVILVRRQRP